MSDLSAVVSRLEAVTSRLEGLASRGSLGNEATLPTGGGESVEKYDEEILGGKLKDYLSLSGKIGGEVLEQSKVVSGAFQELRQVLVLASKHKQPSPDVLAGTFKRLTAKVNEVINYCEKRRSSKAFNNLMTIKEGIGCVGWVSVSPKPAPYVKECGDQAQFYGNRVIKEFKGKEQNQVDWVKAYTGAIGDLQTYVKTYHTTGLVWNKEGSVLSSLPSSQPPPPAKLAGPPPPPPPAIQPPEGAKSGGGDMDSQRANLFASINKGGQVTQGLRKVTDNMKTHKNPELRGSSVVKADAIKSAPKAAPKLGSTGGAVKKNPVLALQGKKWVVEYQEDKPALAISEANSKQTVYVYKCTKSTLKVSGKVNSIILDSCKKMALCFDNVISSVEVVNSQGVQVQVMGYCPTVSIDKTDGCLIYLSKDSLGCEIISAKSSEMNIAIPPKDGSGDFIERPIPEQFKTVVKGTSLVTEATDIAS